MPRLGTNFELVVADIVREMDPSANVVQGEWLIGPDGRRECDVVVRGQVEGSPRTLLIECKDYSRLNPVGIEIIDALASKMIDLKVDVAFVCSNAPFTSGAISKASRLGILTLGVLRSQDPRIRYKVFDELYFRRIELQKNVDVTISTAAGSPPISDPEDLYFEGISLFDWARHRLMIEVSSGTAVRGEHQLDLVFSSPQHFSSHSGKVLISSVSLIVRLKGTWMKTLAEIDATSGLYDWLRKTVRIGPAAGRLTLKNIPVGTGGIPVSGAPQPPPPHLMSGELAVLALLDFGGVGKHSPIPALDNLVTASLYPSKAGKS